MNQDEDVNEAYQDQMEGESMVQYLHRHLKPTDAHQLSGKDGVMIISSDPLKRSQDWDPKIGEYDLQRKVQSYDGHNQGSNNNNNSSSVSLVSIRSDNFSGKLMICAQHAMDKFVPNKSDELRVPISQMGVDNVSSSPQMESQQFQVQAGDPGKKMLKSFERPPESSARPDDEAESEPYKVSRYAQLARLQIEENSSFSSSSDDSRIEKNINNAFKAGQVHGFLRLENVSPLQEESKERGPRALQQIRVIIKQVNSSSSEGALEPSELSVLLPEDSPLLPQRSLSCGRLSVSDFYEQFLWENCGNTFMQKKLALFYSKKL